MRHRENNQNLLTFSGHLEVLRKLLFRILGVTVCIAVIIFSLKNETLSKILCKWKQDSVVSLFLYLDSVFKHKHKLIHNQAPV